MSWTIIIRCGRNPYIRHEYMFGFADRSQALAEAQNQFGSFGEVVVAIVPGHHPVHYNDVEETNAVVAKRVQNRQVH